VLALSRCRRLSAPRASASRRFEFFTATIRNRDTRMAYARGKEILTSKYAVSNLLGI